MKFKFTDVPDFDVPVEITAPGGANMGTIVFTCKALSRTELKNLAGADTTPEEALHKFVINWDVEDSGFSRVVLDEFLDKYPFAGLLVFREYFSRMNGVFTKN